MSAVPASRPTTVAALARVLGSTPTGGAVADQVLAGLADDSRRVAPGEVFFARTGTVQRGSDFVRDALRRGAALVVTDTPLGADVPHLVVDDVARALRTAADAWYGHPQDALRLVGITGTKGKTTTAHVAAALLRAAGQRTAVLGTIGHDLGDGGPLLPTETTTPGVLELRRLLAAAVAAGAKVCVMEVSSHALDQGRTAGLTFDVAVLTNIASDHLDYHHTHEAYVAAKARLFEDLEPGAVALLLAEDPATPALAAATPVPVTTYGLDAEADLRITGLELGLDGTRFMLSVAGEAPLSVAVRLVGRHNACNVTAALGIVRALGVDLGVAANHLQGLRGVRGRLERVEARGDLTVFVDYAHTEDALRQVLGFLRAMGATPLICVVGCGGDRDRTKRPRMAAVASELADRVVLTSDNPRSEAPRAILRDMEAGVPSAARPRTRAIVDRRAAIEAAILQAAAGSTVLIAGKGHEAIQILGTRRVPFDDVAEARRALAQRSSGTRTVNPAGTRPGQDEV
jgi:UDP-N-acetylmuramoyl-L-alanyl-D-glutamate--2,6-diaminopimelate ligase